MMWGGKSARIDAPPGLGAGHSDALFELYATDAELVPLDLTVTLQQVLSTMPYRWVRLRARHLACLRPRSERGSQSLPC